MLTTYVPLKDVDVIKVGEVADFRRRLEAALNRTEFKPGYRLKLIDVEDAPQAFPVEVEVEVEEPVVPRVFASIRDLFPGLAPVPTIRDLVLEAV